MIFSVLLLSSHLILTLPCLVYTFSPAACLNNPTTSSGFDRNGLSDVKIRSFSMGAPVILASLHHCLLNSNRNSMITLANQIR
jgi:hypothetical protein